MRTIVNIVNFATPRLTRMTQRDTLLYETFHPHPAL